MIAKIRLERLENKKSMDDLLCDGQGKLLENKFAEINRQAIN